MKTIVVAMVVAISIFSCTDKDATVPNVTEAVTNGTWRVSHFSERGNDETSDFTGYSFSFQSDGKIIATKNGAQQQGTWSESSRFNIDLGAKTDANKPLGELTDDWVIVSKTSTFISLKDDNATSNEIQEFRKN